MAAWLKKRRERRAETAKLRAGRLLADARITATTGNYARAVHFLRQACAAYPEEGRTEYTETYFRDLWDRMQLHAVTSPELMKKMRKAQRFVTDLQWRNIDTFVPITDRDLELIQHALK